METYVKGKISKARAEQGNVRGLINRLKEVGYEFAEELDGISFTKVGKVESVITEMVPVCEDYGLDVEDFKMTEFKQNSNEIRSRYENGKIIRN